MAEKVTTVSPFLLEMYKFISTKKSVHTSTNILIEKSAIAETFTSISTIIIEIKVKTFFNFF
jgi:hypothetical protein